MFRSLPPALVVWLLWLALLPSPLRAGSGLFAMDTNCRDLAPADAARTVRDLGYAGFGASRRNAVAYRAALAEAGVPLTTVYHVLELKPDGPLLEPELAQQLDVLAGSGAILWVAIGKLHGAAGPLPPSDPAGDALALRHLRTLYDEARARGLTVALYPHAGFWLERVDDCLRLAREFPAETFGVTFNLCHWLKVEGDRDPAPTLRAAGPWLKVVTINGADGGDTRRLGWDRLIQPLDAGTYDLVGFLRTLRDAGYRGPIGLQGYNVPGEPKANLARNAATWSRLRAELESDSPRRSP